MKEFISEEPKTKYYVQFYCMDDRKWMTLDAYTYYVDAVVYLGKMLESAPRTDHRVLRVDSKVAIEVPSIDTEKGD